MIRVLASEADTQALGMKIAPLLRIGDVITFSGGLGAGKTTLVRAILASLGYADEVPSPSFAILNSYDPPALRLGVVHADFYRIEDSAELTELGLDELRAAAVLLAEWPEMAGYLGSDDVLAITLSQGEGDARIAHLQPGANWLERITCL